MTPLLCPVWCAATSLSFSITTTRRRAPRASIGGREADDPAAVPRTGVIYVTSEAVRAGFSPSDDDWCNLGQGQPETGDLPGAPARVKDVAVQVDDQEYAPVAGIWELRETIASLYNQLYRRGLPSQYSAENVAVSGGGRASLTRAAASLGHINLGHFLPDYTAYEELLDIFKAFTAIPILLEPERGYSFTALDLRREILGRGLSALLLSNPCNPTGKLVDGDEMARWVATARDLDCALLLDEFYSHYVYRPRRDGLPIESAARYVENVDRDPVVLFDGLTKNWRYPGWRVTWSIGPKRVVEALASAGSFLDGGGSKPLQRAAIPLLDEAHVTAETMAAPRRLPRKARLSPLAPRAARRSLRSDARWHVLLLGKRRGPPPESMSDGMSSPFAPRSRTRSSPSPASSSTWQTPGKRRSRPRPRVSATTCASRSVPGARATLEKAVARLEAMVKG